MSDLSLYCIPLSEPVTSSANRVTVTIPQGNRQDESCPAVRTERERGRERGGEGEGERERERERRGLKIRLDNHLIQHLLDFQYFKPCKGMTALLMPLTEMQVPRSLLSNTR